MLLAQVFCLLILSVFTNSSVYGSNSIDRTSACMLQLKQGWIPIDCLFVKNSKQRALAEELCRRQTAQLESLIDFPRDWSSRTQGSECKAHLAHREDQLLYAERLRSPTQVWQRVGR